jgi:uncharacterized membrane protein YphA (DoxX/SURF4 family)
MRSERDEALGEALLDVIDAGHKVVADRLELTLLDGRRFVAWLFARAGWFALAGLLAVAALIGVDRALFEALAPRVDRGPAFLICAGIYLIGAGAALLCGLRLRAPKGGRHG